MNTNKKENITIATSALLFAVAFMHLLRLGFNIDLYIGGESLAMWPSYLAMIALGYLAILNFKSLEQKNRVVWSKFVMALFIIDAVVVFYSFLSNISYWGISQKGFGYILIFDIIMIILFYFRAKKASKTQI